MFSLSPEVNSFVDAAISALDHRQAMKVKYHNEERIVEVHALGISTAGNPVVRVYQIDGDSPAEVLPGAGRSGWKLLKIEEITEYEQVAQTSLAPRRGFVPGGRAMSTIFTEVYDEPPHEETST